MSWIEHYDMINYSFEGDTVLFGGHYSTEVAKRIMESEGLNIRECTDPEYIWIRFGFIRDIDDGELINGWHILEFEPKNKRGCIRGTIVVED